LGIILYIAFISFIFPNNSKLQEYLEDIDFDNSIFIYNNNNDELRFNSKSKETQLQFNSMIYTIYICQYMNEYNYLQLNNDVRYLYPILNNIKDKIEVIDLIEHKSGLTNEIHHNLKLKSKPKSTYSFNQLNYTILYQILTNISNKDYIEILNEINNIHNLHILTKEINYTNEDIYKGGNNLLSTPSDFFIFIKYLLSDKYNKKDEFISIFESTFEKFKINQTDYLIKSNIEGLSTSLFIRNLKYNPRIIVITSESNQEIKDIISNINLILDGKEINRNNTLNYIFGIIILLIILVGTYFLWKYEPSKNTEY